MTFSPPPQPELPRSAGNPAASGLNRRHPRHRGEALFENAGTLRKTRERPFCNVERPQTAEGFVAGLERGLVDEVVKLYRPVLKEIDRVPEAGDLLNEAIADADEYGALKQVGVHPLLQHAERVISRKAGCPFGQPAGENLILGRGYFKGGRANGHGCPAYLDGMVQ